MTAQLLLSLSILIVVHEWGHYYTARMFNIRVENRVCEATTEFYETIFTSAGHDIAWEVVQRLNGRISRLRALTLATTDRRISGPAHMARICEAICNKDAADAAKAVSDHLTEASEIARRLLENEK